MPAGWCLWLLAGIAATAARQRFARQPEDQTTIVGQKVTLPCRVVEMSGMVQWTKDGFGLGAHRNLTGFDRYKMIGSDEEGIAIVIAHLFTLSKLYIVDHGF